MHHFLLGAIACLACCVVATTCVALLVAARRLSPPCAAPGGPADVIAVDLPAVAAATDVENPAALVAARFSKAVSCFVTVLDALTLLTSTPLGYLHDSPQGATMSRKKPRSHKAQPFQPRRSLKTEGQKLDDLARDTARVFTSSYETAEDCATECERRLLDVDVDLNYRRVPHEMWRERTGPAQSLAAAMADLILENERHRQVIAELFQRFEGIAAQTMHENIPEPDSYFELVRTRLFPDDPA